MKNIKLIHLLTLMLAAGLFTACYYDQVLVVEDEPTEVGQVSFSKDILPIFNQSCNLSGCHNGAVKPNLLPANAFSAQTSGNYINTSDPAGSELYQWMKGNRSLPMPLNGAKADYNAKVLAWIKQGAQNN